MRALITGLTLLTATMGSAAQTITHQQGETTVPSTPERIVTFDIAALDTLDALGVEPVGLPQDFVPDYLSQYRRQDYTNVGSLFEPNFEVVASLRPDVVIVANRSSRAYDELSELAPTVDFSVSGQPYLAQFDQTTRRLAAMVGKLDEAEDKLDVIADRVSATQALAADAGNALIVLTSGGKLSAYGPGSRFGWIHDDLGVTPVIADVEAATHGDPISFEFILQHDPDYLFVIDRDGAINPDNAAARSTLDNELIKETTAYQNDQIIYLNATNWYIVMSGLNAIDQMVDEVQTALQ